MADALPDILAEHLSVIFCGINPAATAAAAGHSFVSPSNRFWRALHLAGFTPVQLRPQDDATLVKYGYGLTAAVSRPTRSASDLSRGELVAAGAALEARISRYAPRFVAFLGKPAYAAIAGKAEIPWGPQSDRFGGASVWVLPNPSGLNRAFTLEALVEAYRSLRLALD
ncbi:G/U mismatch-specific DNA glycosylase [Labrys okinawensis]|uniref:G/U mismatch-specific DNA glycosylase n=1 Tax=Labrys okinawensis TaxID=346911 RepID=UPI0039BC9BAA